MIDLMDLESDGFIAVVVIIWTLLQDFIGLHLFLLRVDIELDLDSAGIIPVVLNRKAIAKG